MGECHVAIRLHDGEGEPPEYRPGESVRLTVTVTTDRELEVGGVDVLAAVESRGKGFGFEHEGFRGRIFEGTLAVEIREQQRWHVGAEP